MVVGWGVWRLKGTGVAAGVGLGWHACGKSAR